MNLLSFIFAKESSLKMAGCSSVYSCCNLGSDADGVIYIYMTKLCFSVLFESHSKVLWYHPMLLLLSASGPERQTPSVPDGCQQTLLRAEYTELVAE
jgi:hypothetical protein